MKKLSLIVSLFVFVGCPVWFFFDDISEWVSDWAHSSTINQSLIATDQDVLDVRSYSLTNAKNDVNMVFVKDVSVTGKDFTGSHISLHLVSLCPDNDYPNLHVNYQMSNGVTVRTVDLSPTDYAHGDGLVDEPISLLVKPLADEKKLQIVPFYQ